MARKSYQPDNLFPSAQYGFAQVVEASGSKMVFAAGQTAWDKDMNLIGENDLGKQMEQSLENVKIALAEVGATMEDVTRLLIYVVDYNPGMLEIIGPVLLKYFKEDALPANTLLGIQTLALPDFMVEIEATAVID